MEEFLIYMEIFLFFSRKNPVDLFKTNKIALKQKNAVAMASSIRNKAVRHGARLSCGNKTFRYIDTSLWRSRSKHFL